MAKSNRELLTQLQMEIDELKKVMGPTKEIIERVDHIKKMVEESVEEKDNEIRCPQCSGRMNSGWYGKMYCAQEYGLCGHLVVRAKPKKGRKAHAASANFYKTAADSDTGKEVNHPENRKKRYRYELLLDIYQGQPIRVYDRDGEPYNTLHWRGDGYDRDDLISYLKSN